MPSAEGIDLDLVLAGLGSRGVALMVDLLLQALLVALLTIAAGSAGDGGVAFAAIALFLVLLGYPVLFEAFNGGRTLGKMMMGIAVVTGDGTPIGFLAAVIRNVLRFVDSLPGTYTVGMVSILATSRNQRVGDLAAGTLVVRRPRRHASAPAVGWTVPAAPPPELAQWDLSAVTAEEVAAIREFLGRRQQLQPVARAQIGDALARQVAPRVAGVPLDGGPELLLERIAWAKSFR